MQKSVILSKRLAAMGLAAALSVGAFAVPTFAAYWYEEGATAEDMIRDYKRWEELGDPMNDLKKINEAYTAKFGHSIKDDLDKPAEQLSSSSGSDALSTPRATFTDEYSEVISINVSDLIETKEVDFYGKKAFVNFIKEGSTIEYEYKTYYPTAKAWKNFAVVRKDSNEFIDDGTQGLGDGLGFSPIHSSGYEHKATGTDGEEGGTTYERFVVSLYRDADVALETFENDEYNKEYITHCDNVYINGGTVYFWLNLSHEGTGDIYYFAYEFSGTGEKALAIPEKASETSIPVTDEQPAPTPVVAETPTPQPAPVATTTAPAPAQTTEYKLTYITTGDLNVRASATTNSKVLAVLKKGTYPLVIEKTGNWYKISLGGDKIGFISASYVKDTSATPAAPANAAAKTVSTGALNVRSSAKVDNNIIGVVKNGDIVTVIGTEKGWSKINYNGGTAFVDGSYLK